MSIFNGMSVAAILFLFVLAVLWILLPFAIFKISGRVKDQLAALHMSNHLLEKLIDQQKGLIEQMQDNRKP